MGSLDLVFFWGGDDAHVFFPEAATHGSVSCIFMASSCKFNGEVCWL